jgi:chaperonin GroEL
MSKQVFFDHEAIEKLQKGIDVVARAVGSTLGARGKGVIISSGYGHLPIVTKDGVTVAQSIFLEDEVENTGAMLIRGAATKTVEVCGDGTTTSTVLAQSIINQGLKAIKDGANAQQLKYGIEKATEMIVESLKDMSIPLNDTSLIKSVATISANNDSEIGGKIAEAYEKMGLDGILTIDRSQTYDTYTKVSEGAEMINGWANDKFVTDPKTMLVEYDNPVFLVLDYEVKTFKELEPFLQQSSEFIDFRSEALIIVARGFEGEPYNTFIWNKLNRGMKVCLIQAPAAYCKEALVDVATVTGATLITSDNGTKIESALFSDLGRSKKIVVSRASTMIIKGFGSDESIDLLKLQISNMSKETDNAQLKDIYNKRLARLSGSIGVIYVGGATDVEQKERHDRVDDAVRAVKSAIEEGVVPGGGVALIRCAGKLNHSNFQGAELLGATIVFEACFSPLNKMLENAGLDKGIVKEVVAREDRFGYNVKTEQIVDMVQENILDPTKVVRCALQNASSVACQVITSGALLVEMKPV